MCARTLCVCMYICVCECVCVSQCVHQIYSYHYIIIIIHLFTGWTNGVRNLNVEFIDNENYTIKVSWKPPDYDGGIPVHYYKLILFDVYDLR